MAALDRYYRVLGLPPGAPQAEVKKAYRDLAQVWHPDRFADNERLREKADNNLRRINDAYEKLKDVGEPATAPRRVSRLSETYQAIVDMGDMVRNSFSNITRTPTFKPRVVGVDNPRHRHRSSQKPSYGIVGAVVAFLLLTAIAVGYVLLSD